MSLIWFGFWFGGFFGLLKQVLFNIGANTFEIQIGFSQISIKYDLISYFPVITLPCLILYLTFQNTCHEILYM